MAGQARQALRLGRREHRGDSDLLPTAAATPQAHEVDQHARAPQPGEQATHPCRADFPQYGELLAFGASTRSRDARELARRDALPEHAASLRAQEGGVAASGMIASAPTECGAVLAAVNRDRGTSRDATPPTPPGIRVRTTAVRRIKHPPVFPLGAVRDDGNGLWWSRGARPPRSSAAKVPVG